MKSRIPPIAPLVVGGLVFAAGLLAFPRSIDSAGADKQAVPPAAERLTVRYAQGSFELVSRTSLAKIVPPSVDLPDSVGQVRGCWFEVQSEAGKTVYRRRIAAPNVVYTESPTEDNPGRLSRAETVVPEKTISILIPKKDEGAFLVFYGPPAAPEKRTQASGEVGRIRLR